MKRKKTISNDQIQFEDIDPNVEKRRLEDKVKKDKERFDHWKKNKDNQIRL